MEGLRLSVLALDRVEQLPELLVAWSCADTTALHRKVLRHIQQLSTHSKEHPSTSKMMLNELRSVRRVIKSIPRELQDAAIAEACGILDAFFLGLDACHALGGDQR